MIDDECLAGVLLVGWSMGGLVVLDYCTRFDSRSLAGVVIVDVSPRARPAADWSIDDDVSGGFARSVNDWAARWRTDRESVVREVNELAFVDPAAHQHEVDRLIDSALAADPESAFEAFSNMLDCDFRSGLHLIDVPTLILFGGLSTSTTRRVGAYMEERLPRGQLEIFEHCGRARNA